SREPAPLFDMAAIRDPKTLAVETIREWHEVGGPVRTRQKVITIHVGEMWPGQAYRVPVRLIVPVGRKAKGFHLTGSNGTERIRRDSGLRPFERTLIEGGVGLVDTVVQEPRAMGLRKLGEESERRFARSLNPRHKVQYWAWPASLMRAVTAAFAETDHFDAGNVALSGGSKNGASPSMAILHDQRMTAVHASVSPIWNSPLRRFETAAWKDLEKNGKIRHPFLGGHFGPSFHRRALAAGKDWKELQAFAKRYDRDVFISQRLDELRQRKVDLLFHPGTHDFVAFDLAWGGTRHPTIPVYLAANSGHGKRQGHPNKERDERNRDAFLIQHFFDGVEPLLTPPSIHHRREKDRLVVSVRFRKTSSEESGRIWWIFDRPQDGSFGYLKEMIPDENSAEMKRGESGAWVVEIPLEASAKRIDVFSNHRKTIRYGGKSYATYLSSPYTRVKL
ncbi:MAG: hypothetical protein AAF517_26570, partial [Planctomycetota bacterium]